jgi:hypothetical protein
MTAFVDVCLIEGLALPYVAGAETALAGTGLDPAFEAGWQAVAATFAGITLQPLFDALAVEALADMVDAIRTGGEEPPDPFSWFTVPCLEQDAEALAAALQSLPIVTFAGRRPGRVPAVAVSYGTNPQSARTLQIQAAPNGVDAIYAWQVAGGPGAGVQVADIENGWDLRHEELLAADIRRASVFGSVDVDHGTAVAGVILGSDNGVGTIGIVPEASLALVTDDRGAGSNTAAAITVAANSVGVGGVVLIELAASFFDGASKPDVLVEFDPAIQVATRLAALFGIAVVEPAGNGGVDLDTVPALAHTRPGSPTFVDSRAIVVGAAELSGPALDSWQRFSSFGSRVDCFAAGTRIRAPSSSAPDAYQDFGGTSGASAIVAGVVASVQGMSVAATGQLLAPTDLRRLMRNLSLGTAPAAAVIARIGSMPDLRKIARAQGFVRVLPVGAATTPGDAAVMVHLDQDDQLVRRHWTLFTGWGTPLPLPSGAFTLTAGQPAVMSTAELDPIPRLMHDTVLVGPGGVHHLFWDSLGQTGDLATPVAPFTSVAQGHSLAAVRARLDLMVVAAISPEGRLVVMKGDPDVLATDQLSPPLVIDAIGSYRRVAGPAIVSRKDSLADVVVIEDGGTLRWFTGTMLATIGTGWSAGVSEPSAAVFDPGARPALLIDGDGLLAAGVNAAGTLLVTAIDPVAGTVAAATEVDPAVRIAAAGPVALASVRGTSVVLAVDVEGALRVATRPAAGGDFTALAVVPAVRGDPAASLLGGVSAVSLPDLGVIAIVVRADGVPAFALSPDGVLWPPLVPIT